jgi:predicted DNA-binding ribbon-helix-helix protein
MIEYKMLRVKADTYKKLKQMALDRNITLTKLIDELLREANGTKHTNG